MKLLHSVISTLSLLAILMMANGGVIFAQDMFVAGKESRLWIEGSSNINQFKCKANEYTGKALIPHTSLSETEADNPSNDLEIRVEIVTDQFDCGKRRMNRDLRNALKSDQFPKIIFEFSHAETISGPEENDSTYSILVHGNLTVTGVTREIEFTAEGMYQNSGKMQARGSKDIRMTDFNIEPPTGLLGLVKASDHLTVHFDLIALQHYHHNDG